MAKSDVAKRSNKDMEFDAEEYEEQEKLEQAEFSEITIEIKYQVPKLYVPLIEVIKKFAHVKSIEEFFRKEIDGSFRYYADEIKRCFH